ncbi:hypothetical protein AB6A40_007600 [Gnathostoma spinigerum]|uniref:Uncharacterized protein n=1 Tax=Gnathostoma spinigerum TaxID=75299 RepID=A0ABD6ETW2_9BILA
MSTTQWARRLSNSESVRNQSSRVQLVFEDLKLFSNGVFANVYRGILTSPEKRLIAIKKFWSEHGSINAVYFRSSAFFHK